MPTHNKCVYSECYNDARNNPDLMFHRIVSAKWLDFIGNDSLRHLEPNELAERRICSAHFLPSDYRPIGTNGRKRLKEDVSPKPFNSHKIIPEDFNETDKMEKENVEAVNNVTKTSSTSSNHNFEQNENFPSKPGSENLHSNHKRCGSNCLYFREAVELEKIVMWQRLKIKVLREKISRLRKSATKPKKKQF